MADEYPFEQTLTMMGEQQDFALSATINPLLSSVGGPGSESPKSDAKAGGLEQHSVDLGITVPTADALPPIQLVDSKDAIGGFELLGVAGQGGMGVVQFARQNALLREVAIKRPYEGEASQKQTQALIKEAVLMGRLEHPNIVPVHLLGLSENGLPALVMKRISGTSWRELLYDDDHPFWQQVPGDRLEWSLQVMLQVANAVAFAHSQGIIHRDIKPENVMVGAYGEVYLLDWGIGLKLDDGAASPSQFAGTPAYMAPEMLGAQLTPKTDIYLLGSTLHEVLTRTMRHQGEELGEVVFQARRSLPVEYGPEVPEELAAICNKATHREPSQRYASVAEFREAIVEHLGHRAALDLLCTAQERLDSLAQRVEQGGLEDLDTKQRIALHETATECRFALREALRIWPSSERAQELLRACVLQMAQIELAQGNLAGAELLLADVEAIPEELQRQLQQLRSAQEQSEKDRRRLRELEHNLDVRVNSRRRALLMIVLALVIGVTAVVYGAISGEYIIRSQFGAFVTGASIVLLAFILAPIFRKSLLRTTFNRHVTLTFLLGCCAILFSRSLGFFVSISVEATFIVDMLLMGLGFAIAGAVIERQIFGAAIVYLAGLLIAMARPNWAYVMVCLTTAIAALWITRIWLKMENEHHTPQP